MKENTFVWCFHNGKITEPLYLVIVNLIILSTCGVTTSVLYLEHWYEQLLLSSVYIILLIAATLNQGCILRNFITNAIDISCAAAIFLLNVFFWGKTFHWGEILYAFFLFLFFFLYSHRYYDELTTEQYIFCTNLWHAGVILLIFLVPAQRQQDNLF